MSGFPGGSDPWFGKIPWVRKEMATHSSILAWRIPRTEEPGVAKSWTRLSNFTFTFKVVAQLGKEFACSAGDAGDMGSIPGFDPWVRSYKRRKWLPLQYSCLENPKNRGTWRTTVHGVTKSRTQLSTHHSQSLKTSPIIPHASDTTENPITLWLW